MLVYQNIMEMKSHKLERRTRARESKRKEWEKRDFGIVTIPRVDV
jgi:hypothetical protein